ncbi:putative flavin-containing monooxygenase 1 [Leucoagaricus sp. SymC.cos]|nr:putative flavin-containing monooxygenase 1 [Leucoagaricus sp. SymC.cos]
MTAADHGKLLSGPICIIGSGAAGLINAHVLLQDNFANIRVITRDKTVGGVWARERVYPGLHINNVHGEYRFSAMEMPPPSESTVTGGRLAGLDLCNYMEKYYEKYLKGKVDFNFNTEVQEISRSEDGTWLLRVKNTQTHAVETLKFSRIIVATGGCSEPKIPDYLSPTAARECQYRGIVVHSSQFASYVDKIAESIKNSGEGQAAVVVIGGGKSAQDVCVRLAQEGLKCSQVFDMTDSFLATRTPLPDFIRRSRFLSVLSPHVHLRTRLERFLHGTALGGKITRFLWSKIEENSLDTFSIPSESPLRRTHSLFWGVRTNDVGAARPDSYHTLALSDKIEIIAPARAAGFSSDGRSILLDDGKSVVAGAVVLATGYSSSWSKLFSEKTAEEIGINKHLAASKMTHIWEYPSLRGAPSSRSGDQTWVVPIYRGIVPAKSILRRDFAIAGALFTTNVGYMNEVAAHWISSYFLNDAMRLPTTVEEAMEEAERGAAWMKRRFPEMDSWVNASYMGSLDFWTWPQAVDDLLEDMQLPVIRSGGNWLTWAFKVVDLREIASLADERRVRRQEAATRE